MAAVATAQPYSKDAVLGGRKGAPTEPGRTHTLPDYGPFSPRVVYPTGKYLFSSEDETPTRIARGRRMTASDFQVVTLYSDLSRRDIGYLQSIARIYDVTQMRELIQCRLNHMGKKKRCLDVARQEDFDAYSGYLEKKYGRRMPELMPMIRTHPRQPKPWPNVTEYPVVRSHPRPLHAAKKGPRLVPLSHATVSDQEESTQKDSITAVRASEPESVKLPRKTSPKKGKTGAEKPAVTDQKTAEEKAVSKVVRKLEKGVPSGTGVPSGASGTSKVQWPKTTIPVLRKSQPMKNRIKGQVRGVEATPKSGFESKAAVKVIAKSPDYVDMFCSPPKNVDAILGASSVETEQEGADGMEKSVPGDDVDAENRYADEKFEEPTGSGMAGTSEEPTPDIAKSVSLDDFEGVFSPEIDDVTGQAGSGKGQAEVGGYPIYQEDVEDKPAENIRPDEPADEMVEEAVEKVEKSASSTPLFEFEGEKGQQLPPEVFPLPEQEALDSKGSGSPADDASSKDQRSPNEEHSSVEADIVHDDDQQEQKETPETLEIATPGDEKDNDVIHEPPPSAIENSLLV